MGILKEYNNPNSWQLFKNRLNSCFKFYRNQYDSNCLIFKEVAIKHKVEFGFYLVSMDSQIGKKLRSFNGSQTEVGRFGKNYSVSG